MKKKGHIQVRLWYTEENRMFVKHCPGCTVLRPFKSSAMTRVDIRDRSSDTTDILVIT